MTRKTPNWAHVISSTGGLPIDTKVGGISLPLRHIRQAARLNMDGIRFYVANDEQAELLKRHLRVLPIPNGLQSEVILTTNEAPAHTESAAIQLESAGLYHMGELTDALQKKCSPVPALVIDNTSDIRKAETILFDQIRKSVTLDGIIAYYLMRPLARVFTKGLLNTFVTPNQATLMALCCGLSAAFFAAMGGSLNAALAGILYWSGGVIDCIDGDLARIRMQSSKIGEWLDCMVDEFSTIALIASIGIGLSRDGHGSHWLALGLAGAALAIATLTPIYVSLHRNGLPIDTAQFPWFFDSPDSSENSSTQQSLFGKIVLFFGYIVRRDANLTAIALLLIFNQRIIALSAMLIAFSAVSILTISHYIIIHARKS